MHEGEKEVSRKRRTERTGMSEKAKGKRKATETDDQGADDQEKTDRGRKQRRVTVRDPEETDWVQRVTEFMGWMEEWEGSTRGETGGPDTTDDGNGGPDDESDGEAGGADEGGFDGVEGGWGRRAGGRKRRQKGRRRGRCGWGGQRHGELRGRVSEG